MPEDEWTGAADRSLSAEERRNQDEEALEELPVTRSRGDLRLEPQAEIADRETALLVRWKRQRVGLTWAL